MLRSEPYLEQLAARLVYRPISLVGRSTPSLYFVAETTMEGTVVSASIASLVRGVSGAMAMTRLKAIVMALAVLGTIGPAAPSFLAASQGPSTGKSEPSPTFKPPVTSPSLTPDRYGDPLPSGASLRLGQSSSAKMG